MRLKQIISSTSSVRPLVLKRLAECAAGAVFGASPTEGAQMVASVNSIAHGTRSHLQNGVCMAVTALFIPAAMLLSVNSHAGGIKIGGDVGKVWEKKVKPVAQPVVTVAVVVLNTTLGAMAQHPGSAPSGGKHAEPDGTVHDKNAEKERKKVEENTQEKNAESTSPRKEPQDRTNEQVNKALFNQEPVKPPYSTTPLGHPIHPDKPMTPMAPLTPTANSPSGGGPGYTRSGGEKYHGGADHQPPANAPSPSREPVIYPSGAGIGNVTAAGEAKDSKGQSLGGRVTIESQTPSGTWESKTMHHDKVHVKPGDVVFPGQVYAEGAGVGDQFKSPQSGGPHVHGEVKRDGQPVNPLNGAPIPRRR